MHRPLVAAALLVPALGGCGSETGSAAQPAAELRQRADARCAEAQQALDAVAWPDAPPSPQAVTPAVADTLEVHRGLVADLAALAGDAPEEVGLDAVVAAGERLVASLADLQRGSAEDDDAAFGAAFAQVIERGEDAAAAGERAGLHVCYAPREP